MSWNLRDIHIGGVGGKSFQIGILKKNIFWKYKAHIKNKKKHIKANIELLLLMVVYNQT